MVVVSGINDGKRIPPSLRGGAGGGATFCAHCGGGCRMRGAHSLCGRVYLGVVEWGVWMSGGIGVETGNAYCAIVWNTVFRDSTFSIPFIAIPQLFQFDNLYE